MKFGLNFIPSFRERDVATADYFDHCIRIAERADDLGFSSFKTVEHYIFDWGGQMPNPVVFLAALATRTRRARLVTGAVLPAFNNPMKVAAELSLLDNLSNGRLDAGFARAFIPAEFDAFGVPMDESRARYEEGIAIVKRFWTEPTVTYEGKFHSFKDIRLMPRPVQTPHPPIYVAAITTPESFEWAGKQGHNIMIVPQSDPEQTRALAKKYRDAWAAGGRPVGAEKMQVSAHCFLAETNAAAVEGFKKPCERYYELLVEAASSWSNRKESGNYPGYKEMIAGLAAMTPEKVVSSGLAIVGGPKEVTEQIKRVQATLGDVELSLCVNFGGVGYWEASRTIELLARDVIPMCR